MSLLVSNVQRFCIHDGPGIRTTIFLMGCHLRCPWCANPEAQSMTQWFFVNESLCLKEQCTVNRQCSIIKGLQVTNEDFEKCGLRAIVRYGKEMSYDQLISIVSKDESYYGLNGGLTFSGGEPLLNLSLNTDILIKIHEKYDVAIETSLSAHLKNFGEIIDCINHIIVDVKTLDHKKYEEIIGGDLDIFLENIEILKESDRLKDVTFRYPIIPSFNNSSSDARNLNRFLESFPAGSIEFFSLHNLAASKYRLLGKKSSSYDIATVQDVADFVKKIKTESTEMLNFKVLSI